VSPITCEASICDADQDAQGVLHVLRKAGRSPCYGERLVVVRVLSWVAGIRSLPDMRDARRAREPNQWLATSSAGSELVSVDPVRSDFEGWRYGRPMVESDPYDPSEWEAFRAGWTARDLTVGALAEVGRRVLYGLMIGDRREQWFIDRDALRTLVTTAIPDEPPAPPDNYTPTQVDAYTAGWTIRTAEINPIRTIGEDVLAGIEDGRQQNADPQWMAERDQLGAMLGVR
jgi:hypothetical protein